MHILVQEAFTEGVEGKFHPKLKISVCSLFLMDSQVK